MVLVQPLPRLELFTFYNCYTIIALPVLLFCKLAENGVRRKMGGEIC